MLTRKQRAGIENIVMWEVGGGRWGGQRAQQVLSRMGPPMGSTLLLQVRGPSSPSSSADLNCNPHPTLLSVSSPSDPSLPTPHIVPLLVPLCPSALALPSPFQSEAATWGPCYPIISLSSCSTKQAPEIRSWESGVLPGGGGSRVGGGGPPSLLRWPDDA